MIVRRYLLDGAGRLCTEPVLPSPDGGYDLPDGFYLVNDRGRTRYVQSAGGTLNDVCYRCVLAGLQAYW